jgi:3-deoxy-D-manno-octulosonic-acid transferase
MKDNSEDRKKSIAAGLLARYVRLVFQTSSRNRNYHELEDSFVKNAPLIIGGWHGTFLLSPVLLPHPEKVSAVVARHGDAELMGMMLERFGVKLIRGAGAGGRKKDRGGMFALRMSLRELKAGRSVAMTADVPPGPARRAGMGIITIARLSGRPILPVAAVTSRFKVLNSWSRFIINLPFSRLVLLSGDPVHVPHDADKALMEEKRLELETRINDLVELGHQMVGADPALSAAPRVGHAPEPGLALKTYSAAMKLAQPLARPILRRRARRGKEDLGRMSERYGRATLWRPEGELVWIHAASVGEVNAVLPLIVALRERFSQFSILLTTGTVTSAKIAEKNLPEGAVHQFIPLDTPVFMRRFLDHWRPGLVLLVESEIWPNLVLETSARKIPLALVNGIMSSKSFRNWRRRGSLSRPVFGRFDLVLVQNERLQKRFMRLGAPEVKMVGNLKFDAPPLLVDEAEKQDMEQALGKRSVFLAANTHKGEEQSIFEVHKRLCQKSCDLVTIIVPRHPERGDEIAQLAGAHGLNCVQRSKGEQLVKNTDLYIADTLGELGVFFALSKIVFMGGSFVQSGGHNPVEAVRFQSAVITGSYWQNQEDIFEALLKGKGALEVSTSEELADQVALLMSDEKQRLEIVINAQRIVGEMAGAVERTLKAIEPLLPGVDEFDDVNGQLSERDL